MSVYEKAKPLAGIDLNYEVIGGLTPPTSFKKENTLWIDTDVDKEIIAKPQAEINGFHLNYYINKTTGVITEPSSNTCYTKWFSCEQGHEYNFKLSNGQTVLIASFSELPKKGVTGQILYGTGKDTGFSSLDYNVLVNDSNIIALGIYYYDSSANNAVPTLTITDITEMNNIMDSLPDSYDIGEYVFSNENPWVYYEDVDFIKDSTIIQDKYINTSGEVTTGDATNAPCYTENYIPVKYGTTYNIEYTLSASKSMWCRIIEYTSTTSLLGDTTYTFKTYKAIVDSVTGTSQSKTYTPSASTVTHVRICWRTFYPSGTTCNFIFAEPDIERSSANIGDTWIKTDISKAYNVFNAINKNELLVYPYQIKQYIGNNTWQEKFGKFYKNGSETGGFGPYEHLDYIETTGTQYIDTDITVFNQSSFKIETTAAFTAVDYNYNHLWSNKAADEKYQMYSNSSQKLRYKWGSTTAVEGSTTLDTNKHVYTFNKNGSNQQMLIDTTQVASGTNSSTKNSALRLFTNPEKAYFSKAKIYEIKIYVAGILKYHLIPVRRVEDDVLALKDIINNKVYLNNGTGNFLTSGVILEYIK